jgi:hypothetical protein
MSDQLRPVIAPLGLTELTVVIEGIHRFAPERLKLARAYLSQMVEPVKGLANLGQPLNFVFQPQLTPIPFPLMMFNGNLWAVAQNPTDQATLTGLGYSTLPGVTP